MKRKLISLLVITLLVCSCLCASAEGLTGHAAPLFETVKWAPEFPKNAQILRAEEFLCKMTDDQQVHVLLAEVTQNPDIEMMYGASSRLLLIDLDTMEVIHYKNFVEHLGDITTHEEALRSLFNHYWSYVDGANTFIYADHEIVFPVSEEDITAVNAALNAYFLPQ